MVRYGRGRVRLLRKHPETFSLPGFIPAAFVAGLVLGLMLACLIPGLWLVYGGALAVYATLLALGSAGIAWKSRKPESSSWSCCPWSSRRSTSGRPGAGLWWEILAGRAKPTRW